ncbi:MAG TPA: alpha/beta fold hydrolase [Acidimicrobiales bacterium]|nr:alpha/beta fold hydrolase [Acidimicrobiales bacterium]
MPSTRVTSGGRTRAAFEELRIHARDLVFDALAAGPDDGPLVLLLHGFPQSNQTWRAAAAPLAAAGFRCVAPNQRGYSAGARPLERDAYRLPELVSDVLAMASALGRDRFHLVGHDWGGAVAWAVAAAHADRVASLTAVSTPHPRAYRESMVPGLQALRSAYVPFFATRGVSEVVLGSRGGLGLTALLRGTGLPRDHTAAYVEAMRAPGALTAALSWYRAARPSDLGYVADVTRPTLYVWGSRDVALGGAAARATSRHVTGDYRFVPIAAGHWIPETRGVELGDMVVEHLTRYAE